MLHAEKVGIRQVVVVADAQRQNVAGGDIRGQLLDFVQRLIALRGDDAVPLETVRPKQADGLGFQRRGGGAGLDLHVQVDAALTELQHFLKRGDARPGKAGAEPAARVQRFDLRKGQVVHLGVFAGAALQAGVVGHDHHAVPAHLDIQFDAVAAFPDGRPEGGDGVFRGNGAVAAVVGDEGRHTAHRREQGVVLGQAEQIDRGGAAREGDACHKSRQQQTAAAAGGLIIRRHVRLGPALYPEVEQTEDGTLGHSDPAVQQKAEEGQLHQLQCAGEQQHGAGAFQPYQRRDAVQQGSGQRKEQAGAQQHSEVPPGQRSQDFEEPLLHTAAALFYGGAKRFAFQHEQGQHQSKEDGQQHNGQNACPIQRQNARLCPDDAQDIFGHGQLGDVAGGDVHVRERDEEHTVEQDGPVLRVQHVADVREGDPEQGGQTGRLPPAGPVQPVQHDGKFIQVPERHQNGDERDAAQNAGGRKDLVRVGVRQVVHRRNAERQAPDAPHGGEEHKLGEELIQYDGGDEGSFGPPDEGLCFLPKRPVSGICLPQGAVGTAQ